jgi:hypothetical protein
MSSLTGAAYTNRSYSLNFGIGLLTLTAAAKYHRSIGT